MGRFDYAIEQETNVLQDKVRTLHAEEEACFILKQKIQQLEGQISETQLHLDKENAKYHSACRQQEVSDVKKMMLFLAMVHNCIQIDVDMFCVCVCLCVFVYG